MQLEYQNRRAPTQHYGTENGYLAIIEKIINIIGYETNRVKVLSAILRFTLVMTDVEVGALLVIDNDIENMVVVTKRGLPDIIMEHLTKGNLGQMLLKGQSLQLEQESVQQNPYQNLLKQYDLEYLLGLPLQIDRDILGAIVVGSKASGTGVPPEHLYQRLATLGHVVAMYLDNVRLRTTIHRAEQERAKPPKEINPNDEAADELEELLTAVMSAEEEVVRQNYDLGMLNTLSSQVGSSLRLSTVLDVAIKETAHALNADAAWCYLYKDDVLTLSAHNGLSKHYVEHMQHLKPGNGAEGMAFSRNEPVFRDGLLFHSGKARTVVKDEGLRTIAAIPLQNRNITFGSLAVGTQRAEAWTPRDERMLLSIGRQVAQAVANSQLFSDATEKAQNWEANYAQLQKSNEDLSARNEALEQHIRELHQAQRQIWTALAASNEARRQLSTAQAEQQLRETLQRILGKLGEDEDKKRQTVSTSEDNAAN